MANRKWVRVYGPPGCDEPTMACTSPIGTKIATSTCSPRRCPGFAVSGNSWSRPRASTRQDFEPAPRRR